MADALDALYEGYARSEVVEREIRALHNGLVNALDTKRTHPTYGVTKASLWARFHRLEGALFIYLWATGRHHADVVLGAREAAADFGFDLTDLAIKIKNA